VSDDREGRVGAGGLDDDAGLEELEARLRSAHSFTPRAGLQDEIRTRFSRSRAVPWAGVSAAAAVLLAVVGVGFLLRLNTSHLPAGGAGSTASRGAYSLVPVPATPALKSVDFGALPAPTALASVSGNAPSAASSNSASPAIAADELHGQALVYRVLGGTVSASAYATLIPPSGARLLYVAVQDGPALYFEPVYVLPNGAVESALTPAELRP
jgi:hypothetical protein